MKNDRTTAHLDRVKNLIASSSPGKPQPTAPARYQKLARAMGGEMVSDRAGCYCLVTTVYPFGHHFGSVQLMDADASQAVSTSSFTASECEGEANLDDLLFIDTETTGLGGAGAVPFLVGCGSLTPGGFQVRQYLLPDYSDEAAMLERVLTEFSSKRTLVSYNGLAFDMNLIRDRMIVNRVARQIPQRDHYDLLHAARRLWRRRLADCTLTNIEREIFGFHRDDDIPGHLIPSVYFDWLQTDSLDFMGAVLEHNRLDILALYFLLLHVDEIFRTEGASLDFADDVYSLSKVYGRRRHHDRVARNFQTLEQSARRPLDAEILLFHALVFKRQGDWSQAVDLWHRLVDSRGREGYLANLELAKYCEHRVRDVSQALIHAQKAKKAGPPNRRQGELLRHRLDRLKRKRRR